MKTYNLSSVDSLSINSSGGQLLKWKISDTYIKTSTLDKRNLEPKFMYESYAEVIASRIGQRLGLDTVKYKLCEVILDGNIKTIACESKEFKPSGYRELTIAKLMLLGKLKKIMIGDLSGYEKIIKSIKSLFGVDIRKYIDTLLLFDSLILNTDRHFGNFGLMICNEDTKTITIFDNGNSLFCDKYIDDLKYDERLIQYLRFRPFSMSCDEQLKLIDKRNKLEGLEELTEYKKGLLYEMVDKGLPKKRANFINSLLDNRIEFLEKM